MGKYGKAYQAWPSGIVKIKFGGREVGIAGRLFPELFIRGLWGIWGPLEEYERVVESVRIKCHANSDLLVPAYTRDEEKTKCC